MAADDDFLKFNTHELSVQVYNASDLRVVYANTPHTLAMGELARQKTEADGKRMPGFTSGDYPAFSGPVEMEWRSKDGSLLHHKLDLDSIFKERKILHHEDLTRIYKPMPTSDVPPVIIIEANDRSVNVYMFTVLQLVSPDSNNNHREARNNCVLAYSKTF